MAYKIVRDKVPELFEKHHGKPATTRAYYGPTEELWFSKMKVEEETKEFLAAKTTQDLFEEAADVLESMIARIGLLEPDLDDQVIYEFLLETANKKAARLGTMSMRGLMSISEEDKQHYYQNIKGKTDD
jgi:predicted house-cleaning noncanonical NTP pyrophosphatase (MazG superfamily)